LNWSHQILNGFYKGSMYYKIIKLKNNNTHMHFSLPECITIDLKINNQFLENVEESRTRIWEHE
jgi:hypothetical protein